MGLEPSALVVQRKTPSAGGNVARFLFRRPSGVLLEGTFAQASALLAPPSVTEKLEGSAALIILAFCGSEEKRRSKEKQGEARRRRRKAEARRQKKAKEQARGSKPKPQVLPPQYFYFWLGACALRGPNFFAPCVHLQGAEERR